MSPPRRPVFLKASLLWTAWILTAVWAGAVRLGLERYGPEGPFLLRPFAFGAGLIVANAITLYFALEIRRDFAPRTAMRAAWGLMVSAGLFGIVRYAAMWAGLRYGYSAGPPSHHGLTPGARPLMILGEVTGLLATVLLLASLVRMRSSFVQLGLGTLRFADRMTMIGIVAAAPLLYAMRAFRPADVMPATLIDGLERFDPLLIAGCAIACVVLVRMGRDIDGGYLAASFYYVALFGLIRLLALLASMIPSPAIRVPFTAASLASDWLITLAVFYRWQLAAQVDDLKAQYEPLGPRLDEYKALT